MNYGKSLRAGDNLLFNFDNHKVYYKKYIKNTFHKCECGAGRLLQIYDIYELSGVSLLRVDTIEEEL